MAAKERENLKLGERLKTERLSKGLSISQLAEKAELSKAYLSQLEAGHQGNPSLDALRKIAKALDITVGRLIGGEGVRASTPNLTVEDAGLEAFLDVRRREGNAVPEPDVQLLLRLQWRGGKTARSKEDWEVIYGVIRRMWDNVGDDHG